MKTVLFILVTLYLLLGCATTNPVENPQPVRTALLMGHVKQLFEREGEFQMDFETMDGKNYKLFSPGYRKEAGTLVDGPGGMLGLMVYLRKAAYHQLPIGLVIIEDDGIIQNVIVTFRDEQLEWELKVEQGDTKTLSV